MKLDICNTTSANLTVNQLHNATLMNNTEARYTYDVHCSHHMGDTVANLQRFNSLKQRNLQPATVVNIAHHNTDTQHVYGIFGPTIN